MTQVTTTPTPTPTAPEDTHIKEWVKQLETLYPHWPPYSVKAIVELFVAKPELFSRENIDKWKMTELPPELQNTPKEGTFEVIEPGSEKWHELEALTNGIKQEQLADFIPEPSTNDDANQHGGGERGGPADPPRIGHGECATGIDAESLADASAVAGDQQDQ